MASVAQPKVRSRKDGSAIPLDDTDRKLLNLMQGSFELRPDPFAGVAEKAGIPEAEVMERVQYLLDKRIIREVTPIFDTRALGYSSMLVAAKVDADNPHRAAQFINSHPGVTHNYLRNHDFNLWFTLAVEPDSKLGLDGTLDVMAAKTGAESIRQLPTLKLFKIRMDLEMEAGTDKLAAAAEAVAPAPTTKVEFDEIDRAVIRATQGDLPVVPEPFAPAAAQLGWTQAELLEHLEGMKERALLRRVAAILFHRRAGFSANGMGVWQVPEDRIAELGPRMAAYRGISHCYQRPTYADWPYSVFTMAHGRSKEECDAILDAIAEEFQITDRATLYSSTEFKKIRLLYFTDAFKAWEREHAAACGAARLPIRCAVPASCEGPARRGQLAGARHALDRARPALRRKRLRRGAHRRRRQPLPRLRLLVGPADPRPCASRDRARRERRRRAGHELRRADAGRG
jgi:DNA-binding Lrp family transcriptional regulator